MAVSVEKNQAEREKFVMAFNDTMIKIWQERITMMGVMDTKALLQSIASLPVRADGRFIEIGLSQTFLEYGIWQNFGTGKETPRGNHGDIGRPKVRQKRPWFSPKYYGSVMKIKEFMAENLGKEFCGTIAEALNDNYLRYNH